ncbi:riboflavin biosynthesis protein RibA [Lysobacter ciconiae]|uniref:Riboflavin biosynthesis protein RibA n=1 Tax=Novilysobacter ciconiae TaxID=2781022 RepID=A0A7S6UFZ9_9GAMM|nr:MULTISPECIES: riboflavin biosynthesis protein RibA [Lysobacter]QOW19583.1 riboflavin biosynthesis protein RibA [Lysobacter ciconiae]QOY62808.1 riboflavin biosynthesis protein RibA [Lysobacter sp. H21R4]
MKTDGPVFGESSLSKLAAVFDTRERADVVAARLRQQFNLGAAQLQVISPEDPHPGRKMEPESRGIRQTAIKAHITFAILGVVAGLVIFLILRGMQIAAVTSSPLAVAGVLVFFGAVFGLFAGGLITLRPDQDHVVLKVREALDNGRFVIVANPVDREQRTRLAEALRGESSDVAGSL